MSELLRITLHINTELIGDYEVRNVTPGEERATYEVRRINDTWTVDGEPLFRVAHRRADGAELLAGKVLHALETIRLSDSCWQRRVSSECHYPGAGSCQCEREERRAARNALSGRSRSASLREEEPDE